MISPLNDKNYDAVYDIISKDPLSNITLIADITQLRDACDVRVLMTGSKVSAVFSMYRDLDFVATAFWSEDTTSLAKIVRDFKDELSGKEFVSICTHEQLQQLEGICDRVLPLRERQMVADKSTKLVAESEIIPERLTKKDIDSLRKLYAMSGTPAWTPSALDLGPFYGIKDVDSEVISVAGVHYVTPCCAEMGNVATRPEHRRKGYAAACVKSVVHELLKITPGVLLHFFEENQGAQKLYESMGFEYSKVDPVYFVKAVLRE
ncbi:MAG: GNAT family N-acetyltransferase [Candidatus Thorarchaeota archaeon]|nr:GNAT family N-acetyltransferase [Candidatus Thorarchaeota archaeon]